MDEPGSRGFSLFLASSAKVGARSNATAAPFTTKRWCTRARESCVCASWIRTLAVRPIWIQWSSEQMGSLKWSRSELRRPALEEEGGGMICSWCTKSCRTKEGRLRNIFVQREIFFSLSLEAYAHTHTWTKRLLGLFYYYYYVVWVDVRGIQVLK